jgi:hypothetical protein
MKISPCKSGSELVQRPGSRSLPIPCNQYRHPPLLKLHVPGLRCLVQAICCHALVPSRSQPTVPFELMMLRATSMKPAVRLLGDGLQKLCIQHAGTAALQQIFPVLACIFVAIVTVTITPLMH